MLLYSIQKSLTEIMYFDANVKTNIVTMTISFVHGNTHSLSATLSKSINTWQRIK